MKIIISPAKKMNVDNDWLEHRQMPTFLKQSEHLLSEIRKLTFDDAKNLWKCNDDIANLNFKRFCDMDLQKNLTPAILSYEGIQYKYMSPSILDQDCLEYIENHLVILSGFYGVLKPFDGIVPYRLEMQAKLKIQGYNDIYAFWSDKIAKNLALDTEIILNLASKEYSKAVLKYLPCSVKVVTCIFGEIINGKVVEKSTQIKMARGEIVRFMAQNKIQNLEGIKGFTGQGFLYNEKLSNQKTFTFIKNTL